VRVDGHRTAERRSLAYHGAIAERLARDPAILERARARVAAWNASRSVHPKWIAAWDELLARPVGTICDKLREPTEHMAALRQVTPFAGVLDSRTRWALWRSVPRMVQPDVLLRRLPDLPVDEAERARIQARILADATCPRHP
jgi:hypothetical protein